LNPTVFGAVPYQSTKKGFANQAELCMSCHSRTGEHGGGAAQSDIQRLLRLENRSYHPIVATAPERSPSVISELVSAIINCTDCHGNDEVSGPKGPHGSRVNSLLRSEYTQIDGSSESVQVYALCYACHDREMILKSELFPEHGDHIVDEQTSCTTCHDAHGSVTRRALIRFGEEIVPNGVSPSLSAGRLEYVSDGPGSGACYLTCHGVDHGPKAYGSMKRLLEMLGREGMPGNRRFVPARVAPNRGVELD
jgi:cytochrome c553